METHHIHGEPIGIHDSAKDAKHWMENGLTREGLKKLQDRAKNGEEVHFTDGEGRKFKMQHDEKTGFSVDISHHS